MSENNVKKLCNHMYDCTRQAIKKEEITKNFNLWIKTKNLKYWSIVINLTKKAV